MRTKITQSDWISLRLLFMGYACDAAMAEIPDWQRCMNFLTKKYGFGLVIGAFDLLNQEYTKKDMFKLSRNSWNDIVKINRKVPGSNDDIDRVERVHLTDYWMTTK